MDEYIAELYEQWENGNRLSVCREILTRPNPAVTAVYFAKTLIAQQGDPVFGQEEASIFARLLESQTS